MLTFRTLAVMAGFSVTGVLFAGANGCSSTPSSGFGDGQNQNGDGGPQNCGAFGDCKQENADAHQCVNLECAVHQCNGVNTKVTGKIFDPAGKVPLYNVVVYIPNSPPKEVTSGATCDKCGSTALNPVPKAVLTNEKGEFTIDGAPDGEQIPLVFQVGKWRRQMVVKVDPCRENRFDDPKVMHLPRNKAEGDMPQMAITTGGCDPFACLFSRLGIDNSEFTNPTGNGRVHVYKGTGGGDVQGGGAPNPQTTLWNDTSSLKKYDIVLLSCECDEHNETKSAAQKQAMRDYLNLGGRVFATHYHYTWFKNGPADVAGLVNWGGGGGFATTFDIDQTFPKGKAMATWLQNIGATPTLGQIALTETASDVGTVKAGAQRWISSGTGTGSESVKYFTFNAPVAAKPDDQCGRGVMSDIHVSGGLSATTIPTTCGTTDLTAQERALEFLFFDLSSCVQDDKIPPIVPK